MQFVVSGLSSQPFQHLYGLTEQELAEYGAIRYVADESPGFPDRIEMRDADVGESLILVNHSSMEQDTPYRATHAIFILEGAVQTYQGENEIPEVMYSRLQSLRAFDQDGMMVEAALARGKEIEISVRRLFENPDSSYIHAHNAVRGCYCGRIDRL